MHAAPGHRRGGSHAVPACRGDRVDGDDPAPGCCRCSAADGRTSSSPSSSSYNLSLLGVPRAARADRPRRPARLARRGAACGCRARRPCFVGLRTVLHRRHAAVHGRCGGAGWLAADRHRSDGAWRRRGGGCSGARIPPATPARSSSRRCRPTSTVGSTAVFQGLTSTASLVGICVLATLAVVLWRRRDPMRARPDGRRWRSRRR